MRVKSSNPAPLVFTNPCAMESAEVLETPSVCSKAKSKLRVKSTRPAVATRRKGRAGCVKTEVLLDCQQGDDSGLNLSLEKQPVLLPLPLPLQLPLTEHENRGSRFMTTFGEMAKTSAENNNESVLQMLDDGLLLVVSHKEGGDYTCQALDKQDQSHFMEHIYKNVKFEPILKEPYLLTEIEDYERENSVRFPYLLRHYLTHISRESCCDPMRTVVDIMERPSIKIFVSNDAREERKAWVTLQFTGRRLVLLDEEGEGRMVTLTDAAQGACTPIWMSIFFPNGQSVPADKV